MSIFKFIALSPNTQDKFNLWTHVQSYYLATGPSLSEAFAKIANSPEILGSSIVYGMAETDITVDQQWIHKEVKSRADFAKWLNSKNKPGPVFVVYSSPESLELWDERRVSESHLEKQVIESRPALHIALDLLDQLATPGMSVREVVSRMTGEEQAALAAALIKRLPLKSKGVLNQSVADFRALIINLYGRETIENDGAHEE